MFESAPPFIDTHCHILPALDDGPITVKESLAMAQMAVKDGVGTIVATPHIHPGRYENSLEGIKAAAVQFRMDLEEQQIPLTIHVAAEVRLTPKVFGLIKKGTLPCYGGKEGSCDGARHFLLELPHREIPAGAMMMVEHIRMQGFTPVIAHPERNYVLKNDPDRLHAFLDMGCLVQVTAGALCGKFGNTSRDAAEIFLERGWVTVLASDGHSVYRRQPVLQEGLKEAVRIIGMENTLQLVCEAPKQLLC
ncbi:MAG: capsular biosynthesis protein [Magnetococcales bacterium]|nr:capsular biosynthesis protein [Magnetococcales bacterium]